MRSFLAVVMAALVLSGCVRLRPAENSASTQIEQPAPAAEPTERELRERALWQRFSRVSREMLILTHRLNKWAAESNHAHDMLWRSAARVWASAVEGWLGRVERLHTRRNFGQNDLYKVLLALEEELLELEDARQRLEYAHRIITRNSVESPLIFRDFRLVVHLAREAVHEAMSFYLQIED